MTPPEDPPADPGPGIEVVERRVARVVLVDEVDAVLLLSLRDLPHPERGDYWLTPGGGVEGTESLEAAARREVYEETGARLEAVGPPVHRRRAAFRYGGVRYVQHETYFAVRTARFDVRPAALTDLEVRATTGWRWWPVDELARSASRYYPPTLPVLVAEWLGTG